MARVHINFIGPWRLFLGVRAVTIDVESIEGARDYVETHYGPAFEKKLKSRGIHKRHSVWDNSNILLNGTSIRQLDEPILTDGDKIYLLPQMAGG